MSRRGLIIGPSLTTRTATGSIDSVAQDQTRQLVRHWLLMWDEVRVADQGYLGGPPIPDDEFLKLRGFLTIEPRGQKGFSVAGNPLPLVNAHIANVMNAIEEREPGVWALATGPGTFNPIGIDILADSTAPDRGLLVTLQNVIPVPDKDVHIEDVLDFKERRRDELEALREHIESLYQSVSKAEDYALAVNSAVDSIRRASDNYLRTMRERRIPFRFATDLASLNFAGGALAAAGSIAAHAPLATILANSAAAMITVSAGVKWVRRKDTPSPFKYVAQFHQELFQE